MDSEVYMKLIEIDLAPFIRNVYHNTRCFLHQDNSPVHKSVDCVQKLEDEKIRWVFI
jgi:hypothetical protein